MSTTVVSPNATPAAAENVFDLEIKYGALATALAYLVGYQFEVGYCARLQVPLSEMQLNAASLLANGFTMLFFGLLPVIAGVAYFRYIIPLFTGKSDKPGEFGTAPGYATVMTWLLPLIYVLVLLAYFYYRKIHPFGIVWWVVIGVYGINAGIGTLLVEGESGEALKMGRLTQLAAVLAFLLAFRGGAVNFGKIQEQAQRSKMARLLVAPEAIDGARQIGIPFGNEKVPAGSAQLSAPVSFVYQGEHSYFLVTPAGAVVRFSKDKVWGVDVAP